MIGLPALLSVVLVQTAPPMVQVAPPPLLVAPGDRCQARVTELEAKVAKLEVWLDVCRTAREKLESDKQPSQSKPSAPPIVPEPKTVSIELVKNSSGWTEVVLTYTNLSNRTFSALVSIECVGRTKSNAVMGMVTRSFFAHEHGPIGPGFSKRMKMSLEGSAESVECRVSEAR